MYLYILFINVSIQKLVVISRDYSLQLESDFDKFLAFSSRELSFPELNVIQAHYFITCRNALFALFTGLH